MINHRKLLIKYINHVGMEEGSTFLHTQQGWLSDVEFTDEEWEELKRLEAIDYSVLNNHSCSCHAKNAGACDLCKTLGCEVWDFNQVAQPVYDTGVDHATIYLLPNGEEVDLSFKEGDGYTRTFRLEDSIKITGLSLDKEPNAWGYSIHLADCPAKDSNDPRDEACTCRPTSTDDGSPPTTPDYKED